ncbi:hypothetical protein [Sporolactobacillus nakayamae]|uniref:Uncharacterized protein n=1 Tax=Sporolactobacillus nakayamae TaxID=269670 RepID=A0A1I2PL10_9BACL|nr:hypothetical protein [Sporolactobacillus nakayamae]SFG15819.1 hypothetical protein SAMN02982927_00827 [Sporolactobacillus nakayamae]
MGLIDRYIYALIRRIPLKQRADSEKEVRSLIEDMLDRRAYGREATSEDIEVILTELGDPNKLAEQYRGYNRFLIGPDAFDTYWTVLKIVLAVTEIAVGVTFAIQVLVSPTNLLKEFVDALISGVSSGMNGFAIVTIIFALYEFSQRDNSGRAGGKKKNWSPKSLPDIPDSKKEIKRSESIIGIVFSILLMVLFVYSSHLIGIYHLADGRITQVPIFNDETIRAMLPLVFALVSIGILKECLKLVTRCWTKKLAAYLFVINVVSFAIIAAIFTNPALWNPNFLSDMVHAGIVSGDGDDYQTIKTIWEIVTGRMVLLIALGYLIDTCELFYKGFRK